MVLEALHQAQWQDAAWPGAERDCDLSGKGQCLAALIFAAHFMQFFAFYTRHLSCAPENYYNTQIRLFRKTSQQKFSAKEF
jgi:hypothetical protein